MELVAHSNVSQYHHEQNRIIGIYHRAQQSPGFQRINIIGSNGTGRLRGDLEVLVDRLSIDAQRTIQIGTQTDPPDIRPQIRNFLMTPKIRSARSSSKATETMVGFSISECFFKEVAGVVHAWGESLLARGFSSIFRRTH